jgi:hypothetical protein
VARLFLFGFFVFRPIDPVPENTYGTEKEGRRGLKVAIRVQNLTGEVQRGRSRRRGNSMLKPCDSILRRRVLRSLFDSNEILFSFSNLLLPRESNEVIDSFFLLCSDRKNGSLQQAFSIPDQ